MVDWSEQILKYKKGQLSPKEMHALEKEALRNPFVADALEGIDTLDTHDISADLQELDKRFESKDRKNTFWILRIAASLVIVAGSFWLITEFANQTEPEQLAQQTTPENTSTQKDSISAQPAPTEDTSAGASGEPLNKEDQKIKSKDALGKPESIKLSEQELKDSKNLAAGSTNSSGPTAIKADEIKLTESAPVVAKTEEAQPLKEREAEEAKALDMILSTQRAERSRMKLSDAPLVNTITGKVTSNEDGLPLPGVNVLVKGTTIGTVTDVNGNFKIESTAPKPELVFSFIGLQTKEVVANQSTLDVKLTDDATQLSEVVVTGYGVQKTDEQREPFIRLAEPVGGRRAYDNYLKNSLKYPQEAIENKIKGRVTVQFTVKTDGSLDEFNVLKGLGFGCDEEVIRLVKEGPKWSPTTEDNVAVESEVRVRVRFSLPN
jgi:TonB family protein